MSTRRGIIENLPSVPESLTARLIDGVTQLRNLVATEDGLHFLDPWTLNFATLYATIPGAPNSRAIPPNDALAIVLYKVLAALAGPIDEKATPKLEWLRDRLAPLIFQAAGPVA